MSYRGNEPPAGKAGRDMDDSAERGDPVMPDSGALSLPFPPPKNLPRASKPQKEERGGWCVCFWQCGVDMDSSAAVCC